MGMLPITIRKRTIAKADLELIQATVDEHWDKGRTQISKLLCRKWNWVQLNGRLKDMACREVLLTLYRKGLINLPPVKVKLVRNTNLEPLYNSLVQQHHYLGYRQIVGNYLKYIAFIDSQPVASLGWGSAAWSVKSRDSFVGWDKPTKEKKLHFVANNTRFLILPWVSVKCMASKILAINARRISDDWLKVYNHPLFLLETFVEKDRFKGTC